MMNIHKSHRAQMLKAAAILPLAALAVTAFASSRVVELSTTVEAQADALVAAVQAAPVDTAQAVKQAEVAPRFDGNVAQYIGMNLQYPASAIDGNIEGRVIVKFIVSKEGEVCHASVVKSVDAALDAEALRLVSAMPRWTPGTVDGKPADVWVTLPVSFRLSSGQAPHTEKTIVVVDGQVVANDVLTKLDKSAIVSIDVKKDEATRKQYGLEGEGSVLLVTTKKAE